MPCRPGRARLRLAQGKAIARHGEPFTISRGEVRPDASSALRRLKIDPGSRTTGLALVKDITGEALWAAELRHRGQAVHKAALQRRAVRHSRRQRNTRCRAPRFQRRRRAPGWLPPSLEGRLDNILTWVEWLQRPCPSSVLSCEAMRFDAQLPQNPVISGLE